MIPREVRARESQIPCELSLRRIEHQRDRFAAIEKKALLTLACETVDVALSEASLISLEEEAAAGASD